MTVYEMITELLRCPMDSTVMVRQGADDMPAGSVTFYSDKAVIYIDQRPACQECGEPAGRTDRSGGQANRTAVAETREIRMCEEPGCTTPAHVGTGGFCSQHDPFADDTDAEYNATLDVMAARANLKAVRTAAAREQRALATAGA